MRAVLGQAARLGAARAGGVIILMARIAMTLTLLAALLVAALAWRLSAGPVELPWLTRRAAAAASAPDRAVSLGRLQVSWGGFASSDAPPLQLRLLELHASGSFGEASLARADISLPLFPLLGGHVELDTADLSGLRLRLAALRGGGPPADPGAALRAVMQPAADPAAAWARLRHVHVHDASAEIAGVPGRVERLDIDLDRMGAGGLVGRAVAALSSGDQAATLTLSAHVAADGAGGEIQADLTKLSPAGLAGASPELAALAALDAPVTLSGHASLDPALRLLAAEASVTVGAGTIHAGTGTAPLLGAEIRVKASADAVELRLMSLDTAPRPDGARTRFTGEAHAARKADGFYAIAAALDVDHVSFADLPALWPQGTGGPGTRPWMTENITAGLLANGHVEMDLALPADFSDVALRRIAGAIDGHDLTVHWLRPVPPLVHGEARLTVSEADIIDIAVASATQAGGAHGGMRYRDATIHLTGIAGRRQFADIRTGLVGPLADLLTTLSNPRIALLSKRPLPMRDPSGEMVATVSVGRLPLRNDVRLDDLVIATTARATRVHLGGLAAGYDLSDGAIDLAANNDEMTIDGTASVAGFPSRLKVAMDFRAGPPGQVQESVTARSTVELKKLAKFGIDVGSLLGGSATLDTKLTARRGGKTEIALAANLAGVTIDAPQMGLAKRAGQPGTASARVSLNGDKLASIDAIRVEAPAISVRGTAEVKNGQPQGLILERLVLGTGTDLHGEIRLKGASGPISVRLSGPSLDLSPALAGADRPSSGSGSGGAASLGGRPWNVDFAADRVILGPGRSLQGVRAAADSDGHILRSASVDGRVAGSTGGGTVRVRIAPDAGGRRLTVDVADTGALLRAADVTGALIGGHLTVAARWADRLADAPLAGLAEMTEFRIRHAPAIGRVLQALTIYGLVELARGPGLGFARMTAPFALERGVLSLRDARAFSASLGFTAQGRIDLRRRRADLTGTVVPVYFFNSLLGRVPLVGRLFSAEKGGGLIAAAVTVTGSLDDLSARVNPLSVLTPGFLRRLFEGNRAGGS